MKTNWSENYGEGFIPSRGWAPIAHSLTSLTKRMTPFHKASVAFCENPVGGLACTNMSTGTIYISGTALGAPPTVIGDPYQTLKIAPEVISAYAHEIGHLYEDRNASQEMLETIDHPAKEQGYLTLLEIVADSAGIAKIFAKGGIPPHEETWLKDRRRVLLILASVTTRDFVGSMPNKDALIITATLLGSRVHMARLEELEISPALQDVVDIVNNELGEELVNEFAKIGHSIYTEVDARLIGTGTFVEFPDITVPREQLVKWLELYDSFEGDGDGQESNQELMQALAKAALESRGDEEQREETVQQVKEQLREDAEKESSYHVEEGAERVSEKTYRVPTSGDMITRESLRSTLLRLNMPDVNRVGGWESAPPGNLRGSRALQRDALRTIDKFAGDQISPFKRVERRIDPMVPLTCGIILDQSGSMRPYSNAVSGAGWALAHAVKDIDGKVALVGMGDTGYVVDQSSRIKSDRVSVNKAVGMIENVVGALDTIEQEIDLFTPTMGVRLLVIVSDFDIVLRKHDAYLRARISEHQMNGGHTLLVGVGLTPGARVQATDYYGATHTTESTRDFPVQDAITQGVVDIYAEVLRTRRDVA